MTRKPPTFVVLVLAAAAMVAAACGGSAAPASNGEPPTDAEGIIERAREAMGGVTSVRYTVTFENAQDPSMAPTETLNEWAGPDRFRAVTTSMNVSGSGATGVTIRIDDASYWQTPGEDTWMRRLDLDWRPPEEAGPLAPGAGVRHDATAGRHGGRRGAGLPSSRPGGRAPAGANAAA